MHRKPNMTESRRQRGSAPGKRFWQQEYKSGEHFSLSLQHSSELTAFTRWIRKLAGDDVFTGVTVLDIGCGNGRNIGYLARQYGVSGVGFDVAESAIALAKTEFADTNIRYITHDLHQLPYPIPDASVDFCLDFMVSHLLRAAERDMYREELLRVLKPDGWFVVKTFLREGDENAKRMIAEYPTGEDGSYIHPKIGVYEYVWTERAFREFYEPFFTIHLLHKSHGYHRWGNIPYRRRYLVAYLERKITAQ